MMSRIGSVQALLRREVKSRRLETALLLGHIVCYLAVVFLVLSPVKAVCSSSCARR
ncbi:hypothetical protein [Amycolatopsis anabasis]|uniref:hypothetical protein n=1 Tax=Amycolatopsis anabasis TaxID=1840409 RepID=UPI00131D03EB|nr:hypothetical protein [Amycolatopsis anabasis]